MKTIRSTCFLLVCGIFLAVSPCLHAMVVTEVDSGGKLTLEDGKQIVLAGIRVDPEGISILRVLAQKQDLKIQLLENSSPDGIESAYVYLQAKYVMFPFKPDRVPDEQEVMLNEFLVQIGAAKVDEAQEFRHKARFLSSQEEARRKGEGLWSYEVP